MPVTTEQGTNELAAFSAHQARPLATKATFYHTDSEDYTRSDSIKGFPIHIASLNKASVCRARSARAVASSRQALTAPSILSWSSSSCTRIVTYISRKLSSVIRAMFSLVVEVCKRWRRLCSLRSIASTASSVLRRAGRWSGMKYLGIS